MEVWMEIQQEQWAFLNVPSQVETILARESLGCTLFSRNTTVVIENWFAQSQQIPFLLSESYPKDFLLLLQ